MTQADRRQHRRLEIRLPLECHPVEGSRGQIYRTSTVNVSTGGVLFETTSSDLKEGDVVRLELTVPGGEGHFPYQGRVSSVGEVVRIEPSARRDPKTHRHAIAARFCEPLKLSF